MSDTKGRGLYHKFNIERTDGKSAPGEKHEGCDYFVLDLTHDPDARAAAQEYARRVRKDGAQTFADQLERLVARCSSEALRLAALERTRSPAPSAEKGEPK